ncbi:MAG: SemiSWEET transporter [Pseudomonadota bacterium]
MSSADLFGYIAATLTTVAFIPQAWLTWKRKQTEGVSLGMYLIFTAGVSAWLLYGILLQSGPIIVANTFTLALALFILMMKVRYG